MGGVKARSAIERLWATLERGDPDKCWIWPGATNGSPGYYGIIGTEFGRSPAYVHRLVYEHEVGPIPPGWQIDHLCRNTRCCNPAHLEAVTQRENLMRGRTLPSVNLAKSHCKWGHPFDDANTIWNKRGHRNCRTCAERRRGERAQRERLKRLG